MVKMAFSKWFTFVAAATAFITISYFFIKNSPNHVSSPIQKAAPSPTQALIQKLSDTTSWKTYTNSRFGFEFSYPNKWVLKDGETNGDYPQLQFGPFQIMVQTCYNSERNKVEPCFHSFNEALNASKTQFVQDTLKTEKRIVSGKTGFVLEGYLKDNMDGVNTLKEVLVPYKNHEIAIIFKEYQQEIFDQNELEETYNQILSTFKFTDPKTSPATSESKFCAGIAGILCPEGYTCKLDGKYPDAGGTCIAN